MEMLNKIHHRQHSISELYQNIKFEKEKSLIIQKEILNNIIFNKLYEKKNNFVEQKTCLLQLQK